MSSQGLSSISPFSCHHCSFAGISWVLVRMEDLHLGTFPWVSCLSNINNLNPLCKVCCSFPSESFNGDCLQVVMLVNIIELLLTEELWKLDYQVTKGCQTLKFVITCFLSSLGRSVSLSANKSECQGNNIHPQ